MASQKVASLLSQTLKAHVPPSQLPVTLKSPLGNLYEILSRTPSGGVGMKVHQIRWGSKEIHDSYWVVSRAQFKREGKNGKAWGRLYWKGKCVSEKDERIRGSLKYTWKEGPSIAKSLALAQQAQQAQETTQTEKADEGAASST